MSHELTGAGRSAPLFRRGTGRRLIGAFIALLLLLALPIGSDATGQTPRRGKGLDYNLAKARKAMSSAVRKVGAAPAEASKWFSERPYSMAHASGVVTRTQPDGRGFAVRVRDIAEGGGQQTMDGYLVTKGADGWWRYATHGTKRRFEPTKAVVLKDAPPAASRVDNKPAAVKSALDTDAKMREQMRKYLAQRSRSVSAAAAAAGEPVVFRVPVILFKVNGQDFQPESTIEKFKNLFSGLGTSRTGTVTEMYLEQSFGNMVVEFDVYGPYEQSISNLPGNDCWYGTDGGPILGESPVPGVVPSLGLGGYGSKGMALEAVPQADLDGVDFSQYDGDGDNYVDFLMMVHSGEGAEATGNPCDVHSHYFNGILAGTPVGMPEPTPLTTDGKLIGAVMTVPEIDSSIGVVAHELMHALGEPDYYGTAGTVGTGDWDLGAGGSWLGIPAQTNPIHFNPVMKINFGWVTPRIVSETTKNVSLRPRANYPEVVMIPTRIEKSGSEGAAQCDQSPIDVGEGQNRAFLLPNGDCLAEGFLIENLSRSSAAADAASCLFQPADFDRQAYTSGLAIWYWDFTNFVQLGNNNVARPMLDVKEFDRRDDTQDLTLGFTRGDPLDLYWGDPVGISSATSLKPGSLKLPAPEGSPWTLTATPGTADYSEEWVAPDIPFGVPMGVTLSWATEDVDDWDLVVERKVGDAWVVAGSLGAPPASGPEVVSFVFDPGATYRAKGTNFLSVSPTAEVSVEYITNAVPQLGASGTLNNDFEETGWQITNMRPNGYRGNARLVERPGQPITFDIIKHTASTTDVSGDFLTPAGKTAEPVVAGVPVTLGTRIYNHGGKAVKGATLSLYDQNPAVAAAPLSTVRRDLGAYERQDVTFKYTPKAGLNELWVRSSAPGDVVAGNDIVRSELVANPAGAADVLLVDNDRGWDQQEAIEAALQGLGVRYHVVVGEPSVATMKKYKAVLWTTTTVSGWKGVISPPAVVALKEYFDAGGRVWMMSNRASQYLAEPTQHNAADFLAEYFGLESSANLLDSPGQGNPAEGAPASLSKLNLGYIDGRPYLDYGIIAKKEAPSADYPEGKKGPKGTAQALYGHSLTGDGVVAARVDGKGFRSVYSFSFGLVQDAKAGSAFAKDTLEFLGVPLGRVTPTAPSLKFNHFEHVQHDEPWRAVVGAVAPGGVAGVDLVYRSYGATEWSVMAMKAAGNGLFEGTIPDTNIANNGVEYFARIRPAGASSAAAAGVAVSDGGASLPHLASAPYGPSATLKYGKCAAAVGGTRVTRPAPGPLPATGVGSTAVGLIPLAAAAASAVWLRRRRSA
jgi:M6 family metalloprotease-like protein